MARVFKIAQGLWIGNVHVLSRLDRFQHIGAFLSLRECQASTPRLWNVGIQDGHRIPVPALDDIYRFLDQHRHDGVLVLSNLGQSRAPAIVIGQLMRENATLTMEGAMSWMQRIDHNIRPHPALLQSVATWVMIEKAFPFRV